MQIYTILSTLQISFEKRTVLDLSSIQPTINFAPKNSSLIIQSMRTISVHTILLLALAFCGISATKAQTPLSASKLTVSGKIGYNKYVDMGLPSGLKWATCNVGAISPTGPGNFYAWGETVTKHNYSTDTSKTHRVKGLHNIGGTDLDVAAAYMGDSWRMPSLENVQELIDNCKHTFVTIDGVTGMLFESKKNGNTLFLPASGFASPSQGVRFAGESGWYWTDTDWPSPYSSTADTAANTLFFNNSSKAEAGNTFRCYGLTVRAVSY